MPTWTVAGLPARYAGCWTFRFRGEAPDLYVAQPGIADPVAPAAGGEVAADVVWATDFAAGCQFQTPLAPEAFEILAPLT
ncbi:hypothetical protein P0F65_11155 [Sphingomonas sp. I4]